jgi:hypothetical protein
MPADATPHMLRNFNEDRCTDEEAAEAERLLAPADGR